MWRITILKREKTSKNKEETDLKRNIFKMEETFTYVDKNGKKQKSQLNKRKTIKLKENY